jgi:hypothetical protein
VPRQLRSLLLRTEVRPAGRLSRCGHNNEHQIRKGEPRFIVRAPGAASGERGYCESCARKMLEASEQRLAELREQLDRPAARPAGVSRGSGRLSSPRSMRGAETRRRV